MVLGQRFTMDFWARAFQGGAQGGAIFEVFPTKDFGIYAGGYGERGEIFGNVDLVANQYSAHLGAAVWVIPRLRLEARYTFTLDDVPEQTLGMTSYNAYQEPNHNLALMGTVRIY